ncbi:methyl farnesoate epoxidase-like isoform X2 [Periplaneta americana]|uniref:methyl farnesoate epoxidase-like isoform X2 n=1 Tax=Periplaneta americana TaxID=6978 RepID=UPI0037E800BE
MKNVFAACPPWLPLVGSFPDLRRACSEHRHLHAALGALAGRHETPVLGLRLSAPTVVVFGHDLVRHVLTREEFDGRPDSFFIRLRAMGGRRGITFTDGGLWHEQRSFALRHLKQLGLGRGPMEALVTAELRGLLQLLADGGEARVGEACAPGVLSALWVLVAGAGFSREDPLLRRLLSAFKARSSAFDMAGGTLDLCPWLRFLAPEWSGYNLIRRINADLKHIFMTTIKEHQKLYSQDKTDDLIDAFLHEMELRKGKTSFTVDQLVMVCMDFFIAGVLTTSTTLDFLFATMLRHPDAQRRVQAELDSVVGRDRLPDFSDRPNLPYVEAVLLEVQRLYLVTPIIGPRRVTKNTTLYGYDIPKNTTVLLSLWSVHHDTQHWGDPEVFRPERHLDERGDVVVDEWLMPFGLGKRRCLGEALARSCTFLFFAGILHQFEVLPAPGKELPSEDPVPGIVIAPQPYTALLRPRS